MGEDGDPSLRLMLTLRSGFSRQVCNNCCLCSSGLNLLFDVGLTTIISCSGQFLLMVIPRRPVTVCEIVSPLKPLKAAARDTHLLMSSVAPLADLRTLSLGVHLFRRALSNLSHAKL